MNNNLSIDHLLRKLAKIKIDNQISLADILDMQLKNNIGLNIKYQIKTVLIFFLKLPRRYYHVNRNNAESAVLNKNILVATASNHIRLTTFFRSILESDKFNVYHTYYIRSKKHDRLGNYSRKVMSISIIREILKIKNLNIFHKLHIIGATLIQYDAFLRWKNFLHLNNISLVICDVDRYYSNAPIVSAAKALGINNATIIHGSTTPINNYLPVIANNLLVWGDYHKNQFEKYVDSRITKIRIIGNPKIPLPKKHIRTCYASDIIGLATTPLPTQIYHKVLNVFEEGTSDKIRIIKAHPVENSSSFSKLNGSKKLSIYYDESVDYFLNQIDVLCVRNSQLGSDALGYRIPIIIIDTQNGHFLQNGELLSKNAGCPVIQNAEELKNELQQLNSSSYYEERISKQITFFNKLFKYIDNDADDQLLHFIENM